jgi:uncharacterized protein
MSTLPPVEQRKFLLSESRPLGRIVSVTGSQAIAALFETADPTEKGPEMGTLLTVETTRGLVLGLVAALSIPVPAEEPGEREVRIAELELVGELLYNEQGSFGKFKRGVSVYPALGDNVCMASRETLERAYAQSDGSAIKIGMIQQDHAIPAMIDVNELLGKHFAVLGTTGTGKSCAVALILRSILERHPEAHIVLLDSHDEYRTSFAGMSEVVTPQNLTLPFWLLTFEEIVEVLLGGQSDRQTEVEILGELIPVAKQRYAVNRGRERTGQLVRRASDIGSITVDTPVPYRMSDLMGLIDDHLGRLDLRRDRAPFKRLKARIEALSHDPRFAFMFGNLTVEDKMVEILSRLFRVPVAGKPVTIMELSSLPSEVVSVVVSVLCRMTFDFALWSDGAVPIHLVCEEAHRYIPQDARLGFEPAKRALSRIAKEGRKYGVSLCIVSQRPAELDATILSQCNTVFAMRMSNERDHEIVKAAISDAAGSLLEFLPSMGEGEAVAFGEGVTLPGRIKFGRLPEAALPRSTSGQFTKHWTADIEDTEFLGDVVSRWRGALDMGSPLDMDGSAATALAVDPADIAPASEPPATPLRRQIDPAAGADSAAGAGLRRQAPAAPSLRKADAGLGGRTTNGPAPQGGSLFGAGRTPPADGGARPGGSLLRRTTDNPIRPPDIK